MKLGEAHGVITLDFSPLVKAMNEAAAGVQALGEAIRISVLRAIYPDTAELIIWELRNGPLIALAAPVRAARGRKGAIWLALHRGRYRPVQRVTGLGWVYCDQWEKYRHAR